jgi:prolyl-tRNA synthetase
LEIGPRDLENNCCVVVRRDNREKTVVSLDELTTMIPKLLEKVHEGLYNKALQRRESMTYDAHTMDEMIEIANTKPGLVRAMWCGDLACEEAIKEKAGLTSRCMPFEQEKLDDVCPCCGKPAKTMVYWGKQY